MDSKILRPWRQVIEPHPDVAAGRVHPAGFAADLAQIAYAKETNDNINFEYKDPIDFFARTYLTGGIQKLLITTVKRISGMGGQPVIKLQTSFGGGKTHSILAIYHLIGGKVPIDKLRDIAEQVLKPTGRDKLPLTSIAVLVGTALDPTKQKLWNGIMTSTLWGMMAAQLGGKEAYDLVRIADQKGVSPGSETLLEILDKFGPCVILIDELVAYMRNIYSVDGLPSGSFDSNITFIQSLTEAVNSSKNSLLVASIPESDIEIGGSAGKAVLERINVIFDRVKEIWEPVKPLESFEIVRRRLFADVNDEVAKGETCRAFSKMYAQGGSDFPSECREGVYLQRMMAAYPIHPDVFDRLYDDWAAIEGFQRTRGVLRLMAMVIHELWSRGDNSTMIMPGTIPFDASKVREEIVGYLSDDWHPVLDKDVDGDRSEPKRIDQEYPRFGAYMAARKVARTIFLGSAPSVDVQHVRGIEDVRIKLGVVQPGEQIAVFVDALNHLTENLTHLYRSSKRYWFDTQPNLLRTVADRASRIEQQEIVAEVERRLKQIRERDDFHAVHMCPSSDDVPDEQEVRLVVLSLTQHHKSGRTESPAVNETREILEKRGNKPRHYKNMLVFVAPDADLASNAEQEIRQYLAWKSILNDAVPLNLDAYQNKQALENMSNTDSTVHLRVQQAYCWVIVPIQDDPTGGIVLEVSKLQKGDESFVIRTAKKLKQAGLLVTVWSPQLLAMELGKWFWKEESDVGIINLWDGLSKYVYLPRLKDSDVLLSSIREGVKTKDFFGYAVGKNENGRYLGLVFNKNAGTILLDASSVIVKSEIALRQINEDELLSLKGTSQEQTAVQAKRGNVAGIESLPTEESLKPPELRRFFGSIELDSTRLGRDAGNVAEEIVQHLTSLFGAKVKITLEIEANVPDGVPDHVVRTVTENCGTLKFKQYEFVEE